MSGDRRGEEEAQTAGAGPGETKEARSELGAGNQHHERQGKVKKDTGRSKRMKLEMDTKEDVTVKDEDEHEETWIPLGTPERLRRISEEEEGGLKGGGTIPMAAVKEEDPPDV